MIWYIAIGFVVVFAAYVGYSYSKMKKTENVSPSDKIKILNNKNMKTLTRSKGLVLVDFWAPWCGPCKMIAPVLNEIAEEHSDDVTIAKLNVDQHKQVAQKFKIRNIPTLILFKDGQEQKRISGMKSKKALLKEIFA